MYLLLHGELPNKDQFADFEAGIKKYNFVADEMKRLIDVFPRSAHPMGVLSSLTSALTAFNPEAVDVSSKEDLDHAAQLLIAKFAHLCAWTYRKTLGLPINHGDNKLNYVENFYRMTFRLPNQEFEMNPVVVDALDKLLILHADHEQNCSTSTVRMVGSAHTGLFASISAGVSALWGPLHGGANQAVIEMLEMIEQDGGDVAKYVEKAKNKEDNFRLMGFGHRVYKNFDPRAKIIKKAADDILNQLGINDKALDIAMQLERVALEDDYFVSKKLYPNVDFYSGIIYRALGIPTEMFTVMFALGRLPGWISQWKEMRLKGDPIGRPRQVYQGAQKRDYVPMNLAKFSIFPKQKHPAALPGVSVLIYKVIIYEVLIYSHNAVTAEAPIRVAPSRIYSSASSFVRIPPEAFTCNPPLFSTKSCTAFGVAPDGFPVPLS